MTKVGSSYEIYPATFASAAVYHGGATTDADTVTINGRIYEFHDTEGSVTAGNVWVDATSGTADGEIAAFVAAINADTSALIAGVITAVADTTNDVTWLYADTPGVAGNDLLLETTNAGNLVVNGATFTDGYDSGTKAEYVYRCTITAAEAATGEMFFATSLVKVLEVSIVQEDAGIPNDAPDAIITTSNGDVTIKKGVAPDWADGDVLIVTIKGTE